SPFEDRPHDSSVGWYLVDDGRSAFEKACGYTPPLLIKWARAFCCLKLRVIAIPISFLTLALLLAVYTFLQISGMTPWMSLCLTV
ncbi:hypothetical protein, partial [Bartonella sp. MU70NMGDW]|uniref:hypothetical protein n=1 Tax=Bartonella sp. MU70NMGDW TaxID=3243561 RepID=UPI0035CFB645